MERLDRGSQRCSRISWPPSGEARILRSTTTLSFPAGVPSTAKAGGEGVNDKDAHGLAGSFEPRVPAAVVSRRYLQLAVRCARDRNRHAAHHLALFPRSEILFRSYESRLNELADRAGLLADAYNEVADYFEAIRTELSSARSSPAENERIDRSATDPAARKRPPPWSGTLSVLPRRRRCCFLRKPEGSRNPETSDERRDELGPGALRVSVT